MTTETIRLAAVDDHPVVVEGIAAILTRLGPEFEWLGSASSYDTLRALLESSPVAPDVVLYDLHLHDDSTSGDGIAWLAEQDIRSVILTSDIRPIPIRDAVTAGAQGVILKSDAPEAIIDVLRQVHAGDFAVSSELAHCWSTTTAWLRIWPSGSVKSLSYSKAASPARSSAAGWTRPSRCPRS